MQVLVKHDSDGVYAAYVGTEEEILEKLKQSDDWVDDIVFRLVDEGTYTEDQITVDIINDELIHDGDSEQGYTLLPAL